MNICDNCHNKKDLNYPICNASDQIINRKFPFWMEIKPYYKYQDGENVKECNAKVSKH